jgi:hypothetical protein
LIGNDVEFNNHSGEKRVVNVVVEPDRIQQSEVSTCSTGTITISRQTSLL